MKSPRVPKKVPATKTKNGSVPKGSKAKTAGSSEPTGKRGKKEEYTARIPRVRQLFGVLLRNQNDPNPKKRFPTNAEIGKLLQPDQPLGEDTVRSIMDMMRDDLGLPVDYIPERGGHGFTEPVAGFPLDAISEEQAYYLIQSVQMLGVHRQSKMFADIRNSVKRACLGICFALNIDFEDIEAALSFHVVGFHAPAPVNPELFKTAMRAILQKKEVTLEHRSVKRPGEVMQKTVEPLHLAMINHALYFYHYDRSLEGKKDAKGKPIDPIRKFALTRISGLTLTGKACKQARAFDVHERVQRGMGAFDDAEIEEVELLFGAKVAPLILERPFHPTELVTKHADGSLSVKLRVALTPELDAAVLRWAGDVEVVGPVALRERMREFGRALQEMHS